ncbi:MAG TPA: hypothetical protein VGW12_15575 [Pyrinomonadaceae bacterium]|nr:hypothetical protein [Pyrinomonadaceae bacterium]
MAYKVDGGGGVQENLYQQPVEVEQPQENQEPVIEFATSKIWDTFFNASALKERVQAAAQQPDPNTPQTFVNNGQNIPRDTEPKPPGADATPAEAAAFIDRYRMGAGYPGAEGFMFMRQLMDHQNDPQWIRGYFQALGNDRTAELLNQSLSYETFQNWTDRGDINEFVDVLRNSFAALDRAGLLNQADLNNLVGRWASSGEFNPQVAIEIFGKLDARHENLKSMFFQAAARQAANPQTKDGVGKDLAAAATHVLGQTSSDNQVLQLQRLREAGGLEQFVKRAMAGERTVSTLESMAAYYDRPGTTGANNEVEYGRIESLLYSLAYNDVRDGWDHRPVSVTGDDLHKLRTDFFNAAAQALTDSKTQANFRNNIMFKDGMSAVFMAEFDNIIKSGLGPNGAGFDTLKFQPGLEKFFQQILFTPPLGYSSASLANFLSGRISEIGAALMDGSPEAEARWRGAHGGQSRMDAAAVAGGLLGMLTNGLKSSLDQMKKDAEAKAQGVKMFIDIAFGFIPGIGSKLGSTAAETFLKNIIGPIDSKIRDEIKNGAVEKAKELIMNEFKNGLRELKPDEMVLALFNSLNQTIPNGDNRGEQNFRAEFTSSYTTIINSPNRIVSQ